MDVQRIIETPQRTLAGILHQGKLGFIVLWAFVSVFTYGVATKERDQTFSERIVFWRSTYFIPFCYVAITADQSRSLGCAGVEVRGGCVHQMGAPRSLGLVAPVWPCN